MKYSLVLCFVATIFFSCQKQDNQNMENLLIGEWEQLGINDGIGTFSKVKKLGETYVMAFENETDMYEWANNCCDSTTTDDFVKVPATYTLVDSILTISTWQREIKILDVSKKELTLEYL